MAETPVEGSCDCGSVRYRLLDDPMFVHCCHCTQCQKQTGGAFAINALIERSAVELPGDVPKAYSMKTDSGRPHDIHRCGKCATALWSDYGRRGWMIFLRVSTLDNPHRIEPDVHIFTRSKVPWVGLPEDTRQFEEYYDMKAEWPVKSWDRMMAARAAG